MRTLTFYTLLISGITAGAILGVSPILLMAGFSLALIVRGFLRGMVWESDIMATTPLLVGGIVGSLGLAYAMTAFATTPGAAPDMSVFEGVVALLTMLVSAPAAVLGFLAGSA